MKSIKRGRGPSMMGGIMCIFAAIFGVLWTLGAGSMGGPLFALFGIMFIMIAVIQAIYNFKNATGKNRYSEYDITDGYEEVDPLNERFGNQSNFQNEFQSDAERYDATNKGADTAYCPYCGVIIGDDFQYCHECGKKLPW
ncbi:MAG: zinc ribbon domain-containing protein [Roseburia sp.]|nr:zinc ribbon domain-containing protein [Roseburia sp.]